MWYSIIFGKFIRNREKKSNHKFDACRIYILCFQQHRNCRFFLFLWDAQHYSKQNVLLRCTSRFYSFLYTISFCMFLCLISLMILPYLYLRNTRLYLTRSVFLCLWLLLSNLFILWSTDKQNHNLITSY